MKKLLGLMVLAFVVFLPMNAKAASINRTCKDADANGIITCTVTYNIPAGEEQDSMTVTLTEKGGAEITNVADANDSVWTVSSKNEVDGVTTVILASSDLVSGEDDLFTFSYKPSGEEGCLIEIAYDGQPITPSTPDPEPQPDPDTPTDNKQTGATLPYVALGVIAVVATGAYLATRNKSKMYKI